MDYADYCLQKLLDNQCHTGYTAKELGCVDSFMRSDMGNITELSSYDCCLDKIVPCRAEMVGQGLPTGDLFTHYATLIYIATRWCALR